MFKILKSAGNREGFALLAILIVMILITVLGTAALNTASDQQMAGRAVRESAKTFYAAQAGLHQIVADWPAARYDTLMQTTGDSLMLGPLKAAQVMSIVLILALTAVIAWKKLWARTGCPTSSRSALRRAGAGC